MTNPCEYCDKDLATDNVTSFCNSQCRFEYFESEADYANDRYYHEKTETELNDIQHTRNTCYGDD